MNPSKWGPKCWYFLHTVALNYPKNPTEDEKKHYKDFYSSVQDILPCSNCCKNYKKHLEVLPLDDNVMSTRKNLFLWTVEMHNKVNDLKHRSRVNQEHIINKYCRRYHIDRWTIF